MADPEAQYATSEASAGSGKQMGPPGTTRPMTETVRLKCVQSERALTGISQAGSTSASDRIPTTAESKWYKHPLLRKHRKTILAAVFLFLLGSVFLVLGALAVVDQELDYIISYFVIAGLTFIPGGYQLFHIYRVFKGDADYAFSQIASYDNDPHD